MSELNVIAEQLGDAFDDFKARHEKRVDEIEMKLNRPDLGRSTAEDASAPEQFSRALKSWQPERASARVDYDDYRKGFDKYLRHGDRVLDPTEIKAMQAGVDPDGGYLVTSELHREIVRSEFSTSVVRSVARNLSIGHGSIEIPASLSLPATGWVGETTARAVTDAGTLGKITISPGEVYAQPEVTQRLLDDGDFDVEAFVGDVIGQAFGIVEDEAFIAGDGINKPRGFTTYPTATTADAAGTRAFGTMQHHGTGVSGNWPATDTLIYDLLVEVVSSLRPAFRRNAKWLMPTAAIARLSKLRDEQKNPMWQRSLIPGTPPTLLGYEVVEAENMPAIAASSLSVAFGDFQRGYWVVDRFGTRLLRDPYTNKPNVRFYATRRVGGGVVDSSAIKLIKFV